MEDGGLIMNGGDAWMEDENKIREITIEDFFMTHTH